MCTRPDRTSIPLSAAAVAQDTAALMIAMLVLIAAVITVPFRLVHRAANRWRLPNTIGHVGIQILLSDATCVAELRGTIRRALESAACTWSPLPLPLDLVVVGPVQRFPHAARSTYTRVFPAREPRVATRWLDA